MPLSGIQIKQADADADCLVVSTGLHVAEEAGVPVIIVGSDTDLFVMLVARTVP